MRSTKGLLFSIVAVLILSFLFFSYSWIGDTVQRIEYFVSGAFDDSFSYERFSELRLENQQLKSEIKSLRENPSLRKDFQYLKGLVYSQYPFNDENTLTINLGREQGVEKDDPVLTEQEFLLGRVVSVKNHQSEVQTIFDSDWESSVAIGPNRVEAVIQGGSTPSLDLIPAEAEVEVGDSIVNTSEKYPLYRLIGNVGKINESESGLWRKGGVEVPYSLEDMREVLVITDFP